MNNKLIAAQCLIEAANIINESHGSHGLMTKALSEKLKNLEKVKDENEKIRQQYKKAGYEDKAPKSVQYKIDDIKATIEKEKQIKESDYGSDYNKKALANKAYCLDTQDAHDVYNSSKRENKSKEIHNRINDRSKNECVALLLAEAAELLNE